MSISLKHFYNLFQGTPKDYYPDIPTHSLLAWQKRLRKDSAFADKEYRQFAKSDQCSEKAYVQFKQAELRRDITDFEYLLSKQTIQARSAYN